MTAKVIKRALTNAIPQHHFHCVCLRLSLSHFPNTMVMNIKGKEQWAIGGRVITNGFSLENSTKQRPCTNQLSPQPSTVQTVGKTLGKISPHPKHKALPGEYEASGILR